MFLQPDGKEIIVETRDGMSHTIAINKVFDPNEVTGKWMNRLDFGYGANNFLFCMGKPLI